MAISMYSASVPVIVQILGGLKGVLDKGEAQATAKKWDPTTTLNWRLYPDMFTLERQVRQVCVHALAPARVAGVDLPTLSDSDNSWEEMKSRVGKVLDFLQTLNAGQIDGKEDSQVTVPVGGQPRQFKGQNYLFHFAMPNFYFHSTTAYNILRSVGVEIGKRDFMGQVPG